MIIRAIVKNSPVSHRVEVRTADVSQSLPVQPTATGRGSSINGGEFLMLALATCYCNDLFREAARLGISVTAAEVEASADFPGIGLAATNIRYQAKVESSASPDAVARLILETDAVAEIHNTVRAGVSVELIHG
jgi:organic hydroperoxide reductase OsmC/OhrA